LQKKKVESLQRTSRRSGEEAGGGKRRSRTFAKRTGEYPTDDRLSRAGEGGLSGTQLRKVLTKEHCQGRAKGARGPHLKVRPGSRKTRNQRGRSESCKRNGSTRGGNLGGETSSINSAGGEKSMERYSPELWGGRATFECGSWSWDVLCKRGAEGGRQFCKRHLSKTPRGPIRKASLRKAYVRGTGGKERGKREVIKGEAGPDLSRVKGDQKLSRRLRFHLMCVGFNKKGSSANRKGLTRATLTPGNL